MELDKPWRFDDLNSKFHSGIVSRRLGKIGVLEDLAVAELVADLGSGRGNSTVFLRKICPRANIHTVDASVVNGTINETNKDLIGRNHKHYRKYLHNYFSDLIEDGKQLDAVLLARVPDHQLEKEEGYSLLSKAISESGIVIETMDTVLNKKVMQESFDVLYEDEVISEEFGVIWCIRVWKKKIKSSTD